MPAFCGAPNGIAKLQRGAIDKPCKQIAPCPRFVARAINGLDPAAWLRDTLEKLPTCLNSNIDSLLPLARTP
jgi:hypothetical protein